MSSTQTSNEQRHTRPSAATVDLKLEVVVIPVSDVDRAKRFYEGLGWRLDADFTDGTDFRARAADAARLAVLDPLRQGHHDGRAGLGSRNLPRRRPTSRRRAPSSSAAGVDVSEVFHFDGDHRTGPRARPGPAKAAPTGRSPRSAIRTAIAGCSRRSRRGFRDADSATGRRDADRSPARGGEAPWRVRSRPLRSTTGRTGTPPTSSRASRGGLPTKRSRTPRSTSKVPASRAQA